MSLVFAATVDRDSLTVDLSFEADPGETVALLGPNGAGKSTVLHLIGGYVVPTGGTIELDGRIVDDPSAGIHLPPDRRPIGFVFQDLRLLPHLSAAENVAFPLRARGTDRHTAARRARQALAAVGVTDRGDAKPPHLSGGEAQRVALARALIVRPRLLLLDEPLSALDVASRSETRRLLQRTLEDFEGIRVLVTHDPVEAVAMADRIVILEHGRLTQEGTAAEIRRSPASRYAADLVGVNLVHGRLVEENGNLRIRGVGWELAVAAGAAARPDGPVTAVIRPADVVLHASAPEAGSARNVIAGMIDDLTVWGDRARVHITGPLSLVAEITTASVERLGLAAGVPVWAAVKAVEVRIVDDA